MKRTTALGAGVLLAGVAALGAQPAMAADTGTASFDTTASVGNTSSVGNTAHCEAEPLSMAYYRTWRDVTVPHDANSTLPYPNVSRMSDIPAGIDVAMVFDAGDTADTDYWATLRDSYVPALHAQGTRAVYTLWIDRLAEADIPLTDEAYRAYAQELVDTYVTPYGLDGIDIDVESYPTGDNLTRAIGVFNALGDLIGPKSGTDQLFIFDTNQNGETPLFEAVSDNVSFVLLQAYGRDISRLQSTWETFADDVAPCQFLPGFSFPEELDRNRWGDTEGLYDPATAPSFLAYQYAMWQPQGATKGGFFSYAIDRDGKSIDDETISRTDFGWTKALIALQDEAAGVVDAPPTAPVATLSEDRVTISGTGFANAEIALSASGPGHLPADAKTTVGPDGTWTMTLDRKLTPPMTVSVTQKWWNTEESDPTLVRFEPWQH